RAAVVEALLAITLAILLVGATLGRVHQPRLRCLVRLLLGLRRGRFLFCRRLARDSFTLLALGLGLALPGRSARLLFFLLARTCRPLAPGLPGGLCLRGRRRFRGGGFDRFAFEVGGWVLLLLGVRLGFLLCGPGDVWGRLGHGDVVLGQLFRQVVPVLPRPRLGGLGRHLGFLGFRAFLRFRLGVRGELLFFLELDVAVRAGDF